MMRSNGIELAIGDETSREAIVGAVDIWRWCWRDVLVDRWLFLRKGVVRQ